ncbi:tetratricopeptide repeat protein [Flavobacterium sp. N1994]|uniref:tetratricopeptide repeat-containing sensor histidine kinase n=1 Tax=Flavobacterium sp. N1994 TaxID=2986827 RepID=UPI0022227854|nr:tetratricopeptide repeat protein [Flavobacterium sp. N1994]
MFKIIRFVSVLAFLFISSASYGQDKIIDSLKIVLRNPKLHDTTRIQLISDVMDANYHNEYDKNYLYLSGMMGALAEKNYEKSTTPTLHKKYGEWLGTYYSALANDLSHKTLYEKALAYHDKALGILKSVKSLDNYYVANLNKAQLYTLMKQEDKAIPLIFASLKFFEKDKKRNAEQVPYALTMMSHVYREQQQWDKAIEYSKEAVKYYDISYSENPVKHTLYLKATSYTSIAYAYSKLKKYSESLEYSNKALEITRKIRADTQTGLALSRAGDTQMKLSNFEEAEKLFLEVLGMKTLPPDNIAIAVSNFNLGILYFKKGEVAKAGPYADKAFELSKKTGNVTLQKDVANLLYDIYTANKDYEKAIKIYQFNEKISDSSQIQSSKNELAQQLLKYNFEKKELQQKIIQEKKLAEIELEAEKKNALVKSRNKMAQQQLMYDFEKKELSQKLIQGKKLSAIKLDAQKKTAAKNNLLIGLSGLLLLILVGAYFYYRNNKQKQAIAGLEKNQIKQKLLITQMNPHFIFNSIQNIRSLIFNKQDQDAVNYLDKFSKLTRQILENSNENYISLAEEVEMIENYLAIQQLLYNNKFTYWVAVEEAIESDSIFLPPMLTQPFIENAIKHGLSDTSVNGKVAIHFYLKDTKLFFEVTDNGKGFDSVQKSTNHKSLAMTITKERLVNYTKNQDFVVVTDNILDNETKVIGAKVVFEIPYIYEN